MHNCQTCPCLGCHLTRQLYAAESGWRPVAGLPNITFELRTPKGREMTAVNLVRKRLPQENGTVLLTGPHYVEIGAYLNDKGERISIVLNVKEGEYTGQIEIAEHGVQGY